MLTDKKKRVIPKTKEVLNLCKKFWIEVKKTEAERQHSLQKIESTMQEALKRREIILVRDEKGSIIGIGSTDNATLKLIRKEELDI